MYQFKSLLSASIITLGALFSNNALAEIDEKLLRNLFQDMKNYLGLEQVEDREYTNRIRSVPPPYYDISASSGGYIQAAENALGFQELESLYTSRLIDWNMLQTEDEVKNIRLVEQHLLGFCSDIEAKDGGMCDQGLTVAQGGAADLLVNTLLGNDTLSPDQQVSVWAFIDNLTNPSPIPLPNDIFSGEKFGNARSALEGSPMEKYHSQVRLRTLNPGEGIRTLAARYKQMAFLSTAQNALNQIATDRHIVIDLGKEVGMDKKDASIFEALKFEANRRYGDKNWHQQIYQVPDTALLREIANMQAFQLALDFKRYEQEQIMTTLLAAMVSNDASAIAQREIAEQNYTAR